ncbi:hypothetical protein Q31b_23650 [Novipirellula aureliae]|uniref:Uncharacterized protein n=1 Tax=Novipirellula aureliae TaxID=2527966 RepID=A0A5C6E781_9BACT|nr:hypothetical protein Q31b_23650 [Novipirellula aureliae]
MSGEKALSRVLAVLAWLPEILISVRFSVVMGQSQGVDRFTTVIHQQGS